MIDRIFETARAQRRAAFVPYLMAGDPDLQTTELLLHALTHAGADLIEVGIPYGDPLADGPTIAAAGQRALARGTTMARVFEVVAKARAGGCAPVLLFSYFNPVYRYGAARFARDAARAGAAGAIVPDVALEEVHAVRDALAAEGLQMPLLVAPSTRPERAAAIARASRGFIYVVSRLGVTGARGDSTFEPVRAHVAMLRGVTSMPLAVGFGVSRPEHVREVAAVADGAIVGSALIDAYAGTAGAEAARRVREFAEPLVRAAARGEGSA